MCETCEHSNGIRRYPQFNKNGFVVGTVDCKECGCGGRSFIYKCPIGRHPE